MPTFSFDIVSEVDLQEVDNAVNQAKKEMAQRYDFKGSRSSLDFKREDKQIMIVADDDFKLRAVKDMLATKLAKRGVSLKSLSFSEPEKAFEGTLRVKAEIHCGIPKEKAKEVVKFIKEINPKVQSQIEGEKIKVSSPVKDNLQEVITGLRAKDLDIPLQFTNYR